MVKKHIRLAKEEEEFFQFSWMILLKPQETCTCDEAIRHIPLAIGSTLCLYKIITKFNTILDLIEISFLWRDRGALKTLTTGLGG